MLLHESVLEDDRPRHTCYVVKRFLIRELGEQGYADLELPDPLDSDTAIMPALRDYQNALGDFYADGSVDDPRTTPGGNAALDAMMEMVRQAIEELGAYEEFLDREADYYARLNDSVARCGERPTPW